MKILIVGSDHPAAMEHYYIHYLTQAGIENKLFPAQGMFYEYYNSSILNKVVFKLGILSNYKKINEELLEYAEEFKPDIILAFKGMEIFPATWKELRMKGMVLVNYNPDNPLLFSGQGSGNKNVTNSISLFDLHITYDRLIKKRLEKEYQVKTELIPFGFDIPEKVFLDSQREEEILKVCFLGNPDEERREFLNNLAASGIELDVYGNNWNSLKLHKNISPKGPVYGDEFWKVLRKYRVQLNLMRIHNTNSHNMRTFDIAGVGGIGLYPATDDHKEFFENNVEIFLYENLEDCVAQAKKILSMTKTEADKVRSRVVQRCKEDGYAYFDRVKKLIQVLNNQAQLSTR